MHIPPTEGNFKEGGKTVRTMKIIWLYVDFSDWMAHGDSISKKLGNGQKSSSFMC
jgi:hypothetical protein